MGTKGNLAMGPVVAYVVMDGPCLEKAFDADQREEAYKHEQYLRRCYQPNKRWHVVPMDQKTFDEMLGFTKRTITEPEFGAAIATYVGRYR